VIVGSKVGAGPSHLLPLLPAAALDRFTVAGGAWRRALPAAWAAALAVWLVAGIGFEQRELRGAWDRAPRADLERLAAELDGGRCAAARAGIVSRSTAAGGTRARARARRSTVRVRSGERVRFGLGRHRALSGESRARALVRHRALARAAREQPFSMLAIYSPHAPLFDEEFREAFLASYRLTRSSEYFDIWTCGP